MSEGNTQQVTKKRRAKKFVNITDYCPNGVFNVKVKCTDVTSDSQLTKGKFYIVRLNQNQAHTGLEGTFLALFNSQTDTQYDIDFVGEYKASNKALKPEKVKNVLMKQLLNFVYELDGVESAENSDNN